MSVERKENYFYLGLKQNGVSGNREPKADFPFSFRYGKFQMTQTYYADYLLATIPMNCNCTPENSRMSLGDW